MKTWQFKVVRLSGTYDSRGRIVSSQIDGDLKSQGCSLAELPEIFPLNALPCELVAQDKVLCSLTLRPLLVFQSSHDSFETTAPLPREYKQLIPDGLFVRLPYKIPVNPGPPASAIFSEWLAMNGETRYWDRLEDAIYFLRSCHQGCQALELGMTVEHASIIDRCKSLADLNAEPAQLSDVTWSQPAAQRILKRLESLKPERQRTFARRLIREVELLATETSAHKMQQDQIELPPSFKEPLYIRCSRLPYSLIYRSRDQRIEIVAATR